MPVERIRTICLGFSEVEERASHGSPTWFHKGKKSFASFVGEHHGARLSIWLAARPGAQEALVQSAPDRYFKPPYVGTRGWVGVYMDREIDWDDLADLLEEAYKSTGGSKKR